VLASGSINLPEP